MSKTLFEKLDSACHQISIQESICQQIQRIISTRSYGGFKSLMNLEDGHYINAFGMAAIVDQYGSNDEYKYYRHLLRQQILALEPRLNEVEVIELSSPFSSVKCQLLLTMVSENNNEQFYFCN
jgi:predicted component of type VI protein secretion system